MTEIIIACAGLVIVGISIWTTWRNRSKTVAEKIQDTAEDLEAAAHIADRLRKKR